MAKEIRIEEGKLKVIFEIRIKLFQFHYSVIPDLKDYF